MAVIYYCSSAAQPSSLGGFQEAVNSYIQAPPTHHLMDDVEKAFQESTSDMEAAGSKLLDMVTTNIPVTAPAT